MPDVTILSKDLDLLRETSWWLIAFGCQVRTLRDFAPLAADWDLSPPGLLLVDADHPEADQASALRKLGAGGYVYSIAMCDPSASFGQVETLLGAFDDIVHRPVNLGEIISRLRSGVRYREFERRAAEQAAYDPSTGLATQRGLHCAMERLALTARQGETDGFALLLVGLDGFDVVTRNYGAAGRHAALRQAVDILTQASPEMALAARLHDGDFAVLLPRGSIKDVEECAARVRDLLTKSDFVAGSSGQRPTATFCIAAWTPASDEPEELMRSALKTLRQAKNLGGDMTAHCGDYDQAFAAWQQSATNPVGALASLTAVDVMTPFTACWSQAAASSQLRVAILNSGVALVPFFDEQENYIGVVSREAFEHSNLLLLRGRVETPLPVPEDLTFAELADLLTSGDQQPVVVLRKGRPLGYVTCEALANLLDSVDDETYRRAGLVAEGSKSLIVAESAVGS